MAVTETGNMLLQSPVNHTFPFPADARFVIIIAGCRRKCPAFVEKRKQKV